MWHRTLQAVAFVSMAVGSLAAEDPGVTREVTVRLKDGSVFVGTIVSQDERWLEVLTRSGVKVEVPRTSVASIDELGRDKTAAADTAHDDSRLFLAPTGRPLRKGEGYFSDHMVLFPGLAYGVTDNFTLAGGVSAVPGIPLGEQVAYFTPKLGARIGRDLSVSVGGLLATGFDEGSVQVGYLVTTFGTSSTGSFTGGFGVGHADDGDTRPMLLIGGSSRLSRRVSLLTENWLILGDGFDLGQQPFSVGLRLYGDRLTVDLGVVLVGEVLEYGFPLPWLSFSYHFGSQPPSALRAR